MDVVAITNFYMFEELFNYIKDSKTSLNDTIKEFGSSNIYIYSYKTTGENDEIIDEYKQNLSKQTVRRLVKEHGLRTL